MNYLSLQQIFDKAVRGTLQQGRRSLSVNVSGRQTCAYRGDNDVKCAVGHLIEVPVPLHVNNMAVSELDVRLLLERSGVNTNNPTTQDMLVNLQDAHDCASDTSGVAAFRQSFADAAATIAADFGLSLLVLDEFGLYPTPCRPAPKMTMVEPDSPINEAVVDWEDAKAEYFAKKEAKEMAARQIAIAAIEKAKHLQVPVPEPA